MGITKSEYFSPPQNQMALLFKALGHPARIAIIDYLLKTEHCVCGDIVDELPLAQATISQHLRELKTAGIIRGSVEGNSICYCLEENAFQYLKTYFDQLTLRITEKNKNCCKP